MDDKMTCQICGRKIKAGSGVIAHHGYRRPDAGWQTGSCYGARRQPYEVACDALVEAVQRTKDYLERLKASVARLHDAPPDELTDVWGMKRQTEQRPEGFTPGGRGTDGYSRIWYSRVRDLKDEIRRSEYGLERLEDRLTEWQRAHK